MCTQSTDNSHTPTQQTHNWGHRNIAPMQTNAHAFVRTVLANAHCILVSMYSSIQLICELHQRVRVLECVLCCVVFGQRRERHKLIANVCRNCIHQQISVSAHTKCVRATLAPMRICCVCTTITQNRQPKRDTVVHTHSYARVADAMCVSDRLRKFAGSAIASRANATLYGL